MTWSQIAGTLLLALFASSPVSGKADELPVADIAFEKRLVRTATYTARAGDTLRSVAGVLYGHKTWWPKLVKMNPGLSVKNPDRGLSPGTKISYRAAEVGEQYVVQRGDWLIRIVEWKYGSSDFLAELYKENPWIKNPNRIYPGQKVSLLADGTIKSSKNGEVLIKGTSKKQELAPVVATKSETVERAVAAKPTALLVPPVPVKEFEVSTFLVDNRYVFFGFIVGFLLLALALHQYQKWVRSSVQEESGLQSPGLGEGFGFKTWASNKSEAQTRQGSEPHLTARTERSSQAPASAQGFAQAVPAVNRVSLVTAQGAAPQPQARAQVQTQAPNHGPARAPMTHQNAAVQLESNFAPSPQTAAVSAPAKKRPPLKLATNPPQTAARVESFGQMGRAPYSAGEKSGTLHYHFDPSLANHTATDIERRPSYLSLLRNFKKRYIK